MRELARRIFERVGSRGFALFDFASLSSHRRDPRLWPGDVVFIKRGSALGADLRRE